MTWTTLIDAAALQSLLGAGAPPPVVIDTGFDLADTGAGERDYEAGHLPGAHYWHIDRDLSGAKTGRNGRHPLPDRESFAERAGALGIGPATQVVVYDAHGGVYASRAWWLLRWIGHAAVAVLDGGRGAWLAAGGTLTAEPPQLAPAAPAPYPARTGLAPALDADALAARLGATPLLDARVPERFRGEVEPLDAKAGHIPGALNRPFRDNLGAGARFKTTEQLRAEFTPLLGAAAPADVVHYCGSGVTACHNLLAMEVAGLAGSALYPGSWSEWSSDPARSIALG